MSLESLLVLLEGYEGVHHGGYVVDLCFLPLLPELSIAISVFERDGVTHRECHECLIKDQESFFTQSLEFPKRDRLCFRPLVYFLNSEWSVLRLPAGDELLCVVWVETKRAHVIVRVLNERIQILVDFHHVEDRALKNVETSFVDELVVLVTHSTRQFRQGQRRNIASGLYPKTFSQRKEECERTEVITLGKVRTHSTRHLPELTRTMRESLFVGEEIGVTFHRNPETLSKNVVSSSRRLFGTFNIELVGFIGDRLPEVGICFQPHFRRSDFLDLIQLVMPNGDVGRLVLAFENIGQLHLDGVTATVSNSAFGTDGHNQVVVKFRSALLYSTNHLLSEITRKPLVDR